ncbi:protein of unknown function [Paraburkholderia kururiensis]
MYLDAKRQIQGPHTRTIPLHGMPSHRAGRWRWLTGARGYDGFGYGALDTRIAAMFQGTDAKYVPVFGIYWRQAHATSRCGR